jgi:hypothetical protein
MHILATPNTPARVVGNVVKNIVLSHRIHQVDGYLQFPLPLHSPTQAGVYISYCVYLIRTR